MSIDYQHLAEQLEQVAAGPAPSFLNDEPVRRRLLVAMQKAIPEIESFQDTCQRLMLTPLELSIAQVGCNLKLFETLAAAKAPMTTEQLAQSFNADKDMLDRLLKYMASLAMIHETGVSTWKASRMTRTLAQPGAAGGIYHYLQNVGPGFLALPKWLEDHQYRPPTSMADAPLTSARNGQTIVEFVLSDPRNLESTELYMTIHRFSEGAWINAFPFKETEAKAAADPKRTLFVDVAGGYGHQCKALLEKRPEWSGRVILQDLPPVLEKAPPVPGVEMKGFDMFSEPPVKGAGTYYLRSVLHDWPDDKCLTILEHIKSVMAPDSLLLIDETVVPAKGASRISIQIDLVMLLSLGAAERAEKHWHELLQKAGFKIEHIHKYHDQDDEGLIVAKIA